MSKISRTVSVDQIKNIDTILSYIIIKKLTCPIVKSDAYKLGLVNNSGNIVREPVTEDEQASLTLLDKVVFKLKRLLGTKAIALNTFLYLQTMNNNFYNKLTVKGTIQQRAEVIRIQKDVDKLREDNSINSRELLDLLILEELNKNEEII